MPLNPVQRHVRARLAASQRYAAPPAGDSTEAVTALAGVLNPKPSDDPVVLLASVDSVRRQVDMALRQQRTALAARAYARLTHGEGGAL